MNRKWKYQRKFAERTEPDVLADADKSAWWWTWGLPAAVLRVLDTRLLL